MRGAAALESVHVDGQANRARPLNHEDDFRPLDWLIAFWYRIIIISASPGLTRAHPRTTTLRAKPMQD